MLLDGANLFAMTPAEFEGKVAVHVVERLNRY